MLTAFLKVKHSRAMGSLLISAWVISNVGCFIVMDPVLTDEVYVGKSSASAIKGVYVHTQKVSDKYKNSADTVWVVEPDGTIWKLSILGTEPAYWDLTRRLPDGKEEMIPLEQYEWGCQDATRWSPEWSLTPVTE